MLERPDPLQCISAVTLVTADMGRAVRFYVSLGFPLRYGGDGVPFSSFHVGDGYLNLQLDPTWTPRTPVWGRIVLWVHDVDAMYRKALDAGLSPQMPPADASWGERYFHLRDRDGHELSFAHLLPPLPAPPP